MPSEKATIVFIRSEENEAKPFFCPKHKILYDCMWADDTLWLPLALEGKFVQGRFIFDGDTMLDCDIKVQKNNDTCLCQ